ncbi:hypothetical protein PENTCL1PPCAC_5992, partial [Pristionchus entomophagus]
ANEWYAFPYDSFPPTSTIPIYTNLDRASSVIKRAPITVLVPRQPTPPPPQPVSYTTDKKESSPELNRLESTVSSEDSIPSKRRKYTLKKDAERSDPEYKNMRSKNNESVRKTREKKKAEDEEMRIRNEEEKKALREIVKIMMTRETQHLQQISLLQRLEAPSKIIELSGTLNEMQRKLCDEIRKECSSLADYRLQMLV